MVKMTAKEIFDALADGQSIAELLETTGATLEDLIAILRASQPTQVDPTTPAPVDVGDTETRTGEALDTSYPDALNVSDQLALGTIQLEGTENAVTPEQATASLLLWQALQGSVTTQAEVAAALKQIEGTMTSEQLEAIAILQLAQKDLRTWMQDQGLGLGEGPGMGGGNHEISLEVRTTRQSGILLNSLIELLEARAGGV